MSPEPGAVSVPDFVKSRTSGRSFVPPASVSSTLARESASSRAANVHPAEPAPTMT
ncbi:hypothetical protein [Micromonospora okii]|uniref:hypothetical protein n=1 Tax=Micromonospora okii TaxID=1182970 RepID=UPI002795A376|nr:hypothetical protein [Micromonospora okii]